MQLRLDKLASALNHTRRYLHSKSAMTSSNSLPSIPASSRLTPLIYRLTGGNPGKFTLQGTNTYLIGEGASRILIDTGQGSPVWAESLKNYLEQENASVTMVLLTHHHPDHTGGLKDVPYAKKAGQTTWRYPALPTTQAYRDLLDRTLTEYGRPVSDLEEGTEFNVPGTENVKLRTIHAPGHTPDHCVFLLESNKQDTGSVEHVEPILFTGDAVLGHGTAVFEDLGVYMASLQKMLDLVTEVSSDKPMAAYPAHGEVIPNAAAKLREYIAHRAQREQQVLDVLREKSAAISDKDSAESGLLPMDLVKVIYRDYPESLHAPAEGGVKLILKKLLGERKVVNHGEYWSLGKD